MPVVVFCKDMRSWHRDINCVFSSKFTCGCLCAWACVYYCGSEQLSFEVSCEDERILKVHPDLTARTELTSFICLFAKCDITEFCLQIKKIWCASYWKELFKASSVSVLWNSLQNKAVCKKKKSVTTAGNFSISIRIYFYCNSLKKQFVLISHLPTMAYTFL